MESVMHNWNDFHNWLVFQATTKKVKSFLELIKAPHKRGFSLFSNSIERAIFKRARSSYFSLNGSV